MLSPKPQGPCYQYTSWLSLSKMQCSRVGLSLEGWALLNMQDNGSHPGYVPARLRRLTVEVAELCDALPLCSGSGRSVSATSSFSAHLLTCRVLVTCSSCCRYQSTNTILIRNCFNNLASQVVGQLVTHDLNLENIYKLVNSMHRDFLLLVDTQNTI